MSEVKVLKLSSGEEIIAHVEMAAGVFQLEKPLVVQSGIAPDERGQPKPFMNFLPLSLLTKGGMKAPRRINPIHVMWMDDPAPQLEAHYREAVGDIVTPPSGIITA